MNPGSDEKAFDPYYVWLGIRPEEQPPNYYRLLGLVLFEDDVDVIASAADRQMAHLRTFQSGKHSVRSQQLLNEVSQARVRLLKPEAKAVYDVELQRELKAKQEASAARRRRLKEKPWPVVPLAITGGGVALLGIGLLVWLFARGETPAPAKTKTAVAAVTQEAKEKKIEVAAPLEIPVVPLPEAPAEEPSSPPVEDILTLTNQTDSPMPEVALPTATPEAVVSNDPAPPSSPPTFTSSEPDEVAVSNSPAEEPETMYDPSASGKQTAARISPPPDNNSPEPAAVPETSEPMESVPSEAKPTESVSRERQPVPSAEARKAALQQLLSTISASQTKTTDDKLKLFQELIDAAKATPNNPAERFVLIWKACELAREAGDANLMLQAIEALSSEFEINLMKVSEKELLQFAEGANNLGKLQSLVEAANRAINRAMAAENYASAEHLAEAVVRVTLRPQGKEFRSDAAAVRDAVKAIAALRQEIKTAQETLQANEADPTANLTLGRYECFIHDAWETGLAYFLKADDAGLKKLAAQELNAPPESQDAQLQLADAWWELGKSRQGEESDALLLRAGYWYEQVMQTNQSGLIKLKVDKRLEELTAIRQRVEHLPAKRPFPAPADTNPLWEN